jgi:hypothetical protein
MSVFRRFGIPAAGLLVALALLEFRKGSSRGEAERALAIRSSPLLPAAVRASESVPAPGPRSAPFPTAIPRTMPAEVPAGVLSGPIAVEGPGEEPGALKELSLTASQRTVLDALVARRDAILDEIRREVDMRAPKGADVDRLCARATAAQEGCLSSIRSTLLPDQIERFDRLVKSGRWGAVTLVIPMAR